MPIPAVPDRRPQSLAEVYAFVVVLLLFLGVFLFMTSCGTEDLVFPGNIPATATSQNTATPVPTSI
jgi:energy-converting hydrogenase Eha subunit F